MNIGTIIEIGIATSSWILFILQSYYFRSERFYLWVNRILLKYFKKTYTDWQLKIRYDIEEDNKFNESPIEKIKDFFKKDSIGSVPYKIRFGQALEDIIEIFIDEKKVFILEYEINQKENKSSLWLKSLKYEVVSWEYDKEIHEVIDFLERFEKELKIKEEPYYEIIITFKNNNPYYGFLVRHLPARKLQSFNLSFELPYDDGTVIFAEKDNVRIDSNRLSMLHDTVLRYLRLERALYSAK